MRYLALLRGINVGGKNKVPMAELKACFEELGFTDVSTYINSGNVIFKAQEGVTDTEQQLEELQSSIHQALLERFGFRIKVAVVSKEQYLTDIKNAPAWWGKDPDSKHNALFMIAPAQAEHLAEKIWEKKPDEEQISVAASMIFWSIPKANYSRSRLSKVVGTQDYDAMTIRNANTSYKLAELMRSATGSGTKNADGVS